MYKQTERQTSDWPMDRWIVSSVALTNHKSQITAVLHVSSQKMGRPQRQVATVYAMMKGSYYCLQPTPEYEPRRQSNGKSIKKMVATAVLHVTRDMFFLPTTTAQRSGSRLCRESATRYQAPGIYGIARDIATRQSYSYPQKLRVRVPRASYTWYHLVGKWHHTSSRTRGITIQEYGTYVLVHIACTLSLIHI